MEEAEKIFDYLPYSFKDPNDETYIVQLKESFELNYENQKYQFAFFAFHMLYMSYVYYEIWQIRSIKKNDFDNGMIGQDEETEKYINKATHPFALHRINESKIFKFLRLINCSVEEIGDFKSIVKKRNEIAHVNGAIPFEKKASIDMTIHEIIKYVKKIQTFTNSIVEESFERFLEISWNQDENKSDNFEDEIRENFVKKNYLSLDNIKFLSKYNVNKLKLHPNFSEIIVLFNTFKNIYQDLC